MLWVQCRDEFVCRADYLTLDKLIVWPLLYIRLHPWVAISSYFPPLPEEVLQSSGRVFAALQHGTTEVLRQHCPWLLNHVVLVKHYLERCLSAVTRNLTGRAAANWRLLLLSHIMLMKNYASSLSDGGILIRCNFLTAGEDTGTRSRKRLIRRTW